MIIKNVILNKDNKIFQILTTALLFVISYYNVTNKFVSYLGLTFNIGFILYLFIVLLNKKVSIKYYFIYLLSILIISIYFFNVFRDFSFRNVEIFLQLILLLTLLFSFVNFGNIIFHKDYFYIFSLVYMLLAYSLMGLKNLYSDAGYMFIYSTSTFCGLYTFMISQVCLFLYFNSKMKRYLYLFILLFPLIYFSGTRTAQFSYIFLCLLNLLYHFKFKSQKTWLIFKYCFFLFIFSFIFIYPNLNKMSFYEELQDFILLLTGRNLLTGRDDIWKDLLNMVIEKPVFGYGLSYYQRAYINPHNSYLNIIIGVGFVGFTTVFLFVNSILNKLIENIKSQATFVYLSLFFASLLACLMEVMLFQGQIVLSTFIWIFAGIGIYESRNKDIEFSKILVVNRNGIGDVINMSSFLVNLRRNFPDSKIDMLVRTETHKKAILSLNKVDVFYILPSLRNVRLNIKAITSIRKVSYDVIFISPIHTSMSTKWYFRLFKGGHLISEKKIFYFESDRFKYSTVYKDNIIHRNNSLIESINKTIYTEQSIIYPDLTIKKRYEEEFNKGRKKIAICIGTNFVTYGKQNVMAKQWPLEYFARLINSLKNSFDVILIGGTKEKDDFDLISDKIDLENVYNYIAKTDYIETNSLISICDLLVSCDTGCLYAADALGIKTIGIFGPSDPNKVGPVSNRFKPALAYQPCQYCYGTKKIIECDSRNCLLDISVEYLYDMILKTLDEDDEYVKKQ